MRTTRLVVLSIITLLALTIAAPLHLARAAGSLSILQQVSPIPITYVNGIDYVVMNYSGAGDVTAPLVAVDLLVPPSPLADGSTSGCEAADYAGFPAGAIALVQRGTCQYRIKAANAVAAGAVGVIIFNEGVPGRTSVLEGTLDPPAFSLPVVGISFELANSLRNGVLNGPTGITIRLRTDLTIDTQAPDTTITVAPTNPTDDNTPTFEFIGSDNLSLVGSLTYECQFDSGTFVACTSPFTGAALSDGTHTFQVRATDAAGNVNPTPTSFTWTVNTNSPPTANPDNYFTPEDQSLSVNAAEGILANDTDTDTGSTLTAVLVNSPAHGALTFNTNGSFTYTPNANFFGTDSFTYKANDGTADSNVATVTITVNALSATQEIARLEDQVKALINARTLNKPQGNGLLSKLSAAKAALGKNKTATVCSNLQAFTGQVVELRTAGKLTAAQAQPLLDGANNLRQELGC